MVERAIAIHLRQGATLGVAVAGSLRAPSGSRVDLSHSCLRDLLTGRVAPSGARVLPQTSADQCVALAGRVEPHLSQLMKARPDARRDSNEIVG